MKKKKLKKLKLHNEYNDECFSIIIKYIICNMKFLTIFINIT